MIDRDYSPYDFGHMVKFSPQASERQQQAASSCDRYLSSDNYISEMKVAPTIKSGTQSHDSQS